MNFFLLLCMSAFALVSLTASALCWLVLPTLDQVTHRWKSRDQVLLWSALLALPILVGAAAIGLALLPEFGFGVDHCLAHDPHHPHLCPNHASSLPGALAIASAIWLSFRFVWVSVGTVTRSVRALNAVRCIEKGARRFGSVTAFYSEVPEAYAVGLFRPRLLVSTALLALDRGQRRAVLEHERGHFRRGDLWLNCLARLVAFAHLPLVAKSLTSRLMRSQEVAADEFAAEETKDRFIVAETILALRRAQLRRPDWGLAFTDSHVEYRVKRLLDESETRPARTSRLIAFAALAIAGATLAHEEIHHGLESALGLLP